MSSTPITNLLPANALAGKCIGISVSESPDLDRLGLLETHFRLALAEIARCVLIAGGNVAYGGHLLPEGYTSFLLKELQKYGRRDRPLLVCLAWQEHRRMALSELKRTRMDLGLYGRIVCLDPMGQVVEADEGRGEEPQPVNDPELRKQSLTSLRRYMSSQIQGRVLIGGKRHGFQGEIPGLMEEALIALEMGQPLYLAGGFGGVTTDIACVLGIDDGTWLPFWQDAPTEDSRLVFGRDRLHALTRADTWIGLNNGLTDEENQRLAATHRPSDIAALVSLGLGRCERNIDTVS
jgi:SLOG cluster2